MSKGGDVTRGSFEVPSFDDWKAKAGKDLAGVPLEKLRSRTLDGIEVEPLYTADHERDARDGDAGAGSFLRARRALGTLGKGWTIVQAVSEREPSRAAESAALLLRRGAEGLLVTLDPSLRAGRATKCGGRGVSLRTLEDLRVLLAEVDLEARPLSFESGSSAAPLAAALALLAQERSIDAASIRADLGHDPLGSLAASGSIPMSMERAWSLAAELVRYCDERLPSATPLAISSVPYAHAGAGPALELGLGIAAGIETLRGLDDAGLAPEQAADAIVFRCALGRDLFAEVAKLRAARRLWARVLESCGVAEEKRGLRIHARSSQRTLTERDAWVNLLRATVETFSGAVGGADAITIACFDEAAGQPERFGLRLAAQLQCLLREESHIARVTDPAGGSWYVESLSESSAAAAWEHVQRIESRGGFLAALREGDVGRLIADHEAAMRKAVATRKEAITGVSSYPDIHEKPVKRREPGPLDDAPARSLHLDSDAASSLHACESALVEGAGLLDLVGALGEGASTSVDSISIRRLAAPFEALRDACDALDERPRVFLANMGPIAQHRARAMFSKNLVEAGGLESLENAGFGTLGAACEAFERSGARVAVICSTDETYPEFVPPLATGLKSAGALRVLVAGRPGENEAAWREAGVDAFVYLGCDVEAVLRDLLEALEVIS